MTSTGKDIEIKESKGKISKITFYKLFVDGKCKLVATSKKACNDAIYDMGITDQYNHQKI